MFLWVLITGPRRATRRIIIVVTDGDHFLDVIDDQFRNLVGDKALLKDIIRITSDSLQFFVNYY